MTRRIFAIAFILITTSFAWAILGLTIFQRSDTYGERLSSRVSATWGAPQEQYPPVIERVWTTTETETVQENGKDVRREVHKDHCQPIPLDSSRIRADLHLDYRQKGLLWFSTYTVGFQGAHTFRNTQPTAQNFEIHFPLPAQKAIYDGLALYINGQPLPFTFRKAEVVATASLPAGATAELRAAYRSNGQNNWRYNPGAPPAAQQESGSANQVAHVDDFHLTVNTDFSGFDFPENSLSPTSKTQTANGFELQWNYKSLVSGFDMALTMPEKLQPGPLAGSISYFAPVSLLFFFFVIFILATMRGIDLHPMNYFFLACAFFAFHLLLAYLVDHMSIHLAFIISSAVSIALVVSYLRLVVNWDFAVKYAGPAQFVYLVLFSYAFFFEGFTGLAVTIGAVLTLFVVMQLTGKLNWTEKFAKTTLDTRGIAPAR